MDSIILVYRPYRAATYMARLLVVMEIGYLLFIGGMLFNPQQFNIEGLILCLFFAIPLLFFIKLLYDRGKTTIHFSQEGIHLINCGKTAWRFIAWTDFSYLYRQYNYYGIEFLVLSYESLNKKQLKKMANVRSVLSLNNAVVISMDDRTQGKATAQIRELVKEKVAEKNST